MINKYFVIFWFFNLVSLAYISVATAINIIHGISLTVIILLAIGMLFNVLSYEFHYKYRVNEK